MNLTPMNHTRLVRRAAGVLAAVVVSIGVSATATSAASLPAPTLFTPEPGSYTAESRPLISGVTAPNTAVAVFVDGIYNGHADVAAGDQPADAWSFGYEPFLALKPGTHTVMVRAERFNDGGTRTAVSAFSRKVMFTVEGTIGQPVIVGIVVPTAEDADQPTITGLAPSGSIIDLYVDHQFVMHVPVSRDESVTGSFAAVLPRELADGRHTITAVTRVVRADGTTRYSEVSTPFTIVIPTSEVKDIRPVAAATTSPVSGSGATAAPSGNTALPGVPADEAPSTAGPDAAPETNTNAPGAPTEEGNADDAGAATGLSAKTLKVLQTIGWLALIAAAALFAYQMRRHGKDVDMMLEEQGVSREEAIAEAKAEDAAKNEAVIEETPSTETEEKK
jgi:hypothetical protein